MTSYRPGRERWGRKLVMPSSGPGPAFPCRDPALRSWDSPRRSPAVGEVRLFNSGSPAPSSFWVQSGCSVFVE